jgi:hypothetical protein
MYQTYLYSSNNRTELICVHLFLNTCPLICSQIHNNACSIELANIEPHDWGEFIVSLPRAPTLYHSVITT